MKSSIFLILLTCLTHSAYAQTLGGVDFDPVGGRISGSSVTLVPDYGICDEDEKIDLNLDGLKCDEIKDKKIIHSYKDQLFVDGKVKTHLGFFDLYSDLFVTFGNLPNGKHMFKFEPDYKRKGRSHNILPQDDGSFILKVEESNIGGNNPYKRISSLRLWKDKLIAVEKIQKNKNDKTEIKKVQCTMPKMSDKKFKVLKKAFEQL